MSGQEVSERSARRVGGKLLQERFDTAGDGRARCLRTAEERNRPERQERAEQTRPRAPVAPSPGDGSALSRHGAGRFG